jgi:hypothetical protein
LIGSFGKIEDNQSEGSVPDANLSETDSEHTAEEHGHDGWGRARYCGYYKQTIDGCPNESSRQRYRCRFCEVLCCVERCIVGPTGICRQCKRAWPNETNGGLFADPVADGFCLRGSSRSVDIGDKGKGKDKGRRSCSRSPNRRLVVVKLPTGQSITFQGGPSTTIRYIKAQIAMRIGLPSHNQALLQSLPDGATLADLCQSLGGDERRIISLVLLPMYV